MALGITSVGHRRRLVTAIASLADAPIPRPVDRASGYSGRMPTTMEIAQRIRFNGGG